MKPVLHISRLFQDSFIFGEASPSNFFRVTVSIQQSLFWSSYFFSVAAFLKGSVFERFISSNQLFFAAYLIFRSETSTKQSSLENRKFLRQLLFGTVTILRRNYLEYGYLQKSSLVEAGTTTQDQLF